MAASLYTLIPGAFAMMMYGVVFSTVSEAGIPRMMTGTTIGIASIIGYLPDSIYSVIFGKWMDQHGAAGYNYIFTFLMITGIIRCGTGFHYLPSWKEKQRTGYIERVRLWEKKIKKNYI